MRKYLSLAASFLVLALAGGPAAPGYDNSSASDLVVMDCVWGTTPAGGPWTTALTIGLRDRGTVVDARFYHPGGMRLVPGLVSIPADREWRSFRFPNILQALQARDKGFSYQGKRGVLWLSTQGPGFRIWAQARTGKGNAGMTYPAMRWVDANTANFTSDDSRCLVIQGLTRSAGISSGVQAFNATGGAMYVEFRILDENDSVVGTSWHREVGAWEVFDFNPFAEARAPAGTRRNCLLWIHPERSDLSGAGTRGLFAFGATGGRGARDCQALIAVQDQ